MELQDLTRPLEQRRRAAALVTYAFATDTRFTDIDDRIGELSRRGMKTFAPMFKAAQSATTTSDTAVALLPLSTAFLRELGARTIDGRLAGALRLDLQAAARLVVGTITASETDEGESKPIGRLTFAADSDPLRKVHGEIIVSAEAARALGPETQAAITDLLLAATATARDRIFVAALQAAGTSMSPATVGDVLGAISGGQPAAPYIVAGLDVLLALPAGQLRDLATLGIGVIPSPAAAGLVFGVDATGVLIREDAPVVDIGRAASILMDDGASPPATTVVSLWQQNLIALRAEEFVRFTIRPEAVAYGSAA